MSVFCKNSLAVFWAVFLGVLPISSAPLETPEIEILEKFSELDALKNNSVRVSGNIRIETQTILDRIPLKAGGRYAADDIDDIIRSLVATGFFKDVRVTLSGNILNINVSENPSITKIVFEGNSVASDSDLTKIVNIRARQVLSMVDVREAEKNIREFYKIKGCYAASVNPQIIQKDSNRVVLVFKITEGRKAAISKIVFRGQREISGSTLYSVISSKEKRWYYLLGDSDAIYGAEKLQQDEETLRDFYRKKGYVDVCISDAYAELAPNQTDFVVTFYIKEGARYRFGSTEIVSEKPDEVPVSALNRNFSWTAGDWFDGMLMEGKARQMTAQLNAKGFSFFEVVAETKPCRGVINVKFIVRPIKQRYVGQITIQGNSKTDDAVIRRELSIKDGDPITPGALKFSEMRVKQLGFFDTLEIIGSSNESQDRQDLTVRVKEKKVSGNMGLSGGYNSYDGFLLKANLEERNFMGRGQSVGLSGLVASREQALSLSIASPYFMGRNVTVGADFGVSRQKGYTKQDFKKDGSYGQTTIGGGIIARYSLGRGLVQSWSYRPSVQKIGFLGDNTSQYLKDNIADHKTRFISSLGHQIAYSKSFLKGASVKSGYILSTSNKFTGIGGSVRYMSNAIESAFFYNIDQQGDYKLRLGAKYQLMTKMGYVRFMDQYFLGGFVFPGFQDTGIGPRDQRTKDALGGRQLYVVSAKFDFPIPSAKDFPMKGCFHVHAGSLWDTIFTPVEGFPITSLDFKNRVSVGFGLFTEMPMLGKIGIIFSRAVIKESGDQPQSIEVVFGRDF